MRRLPGAVADAGPLLHLAEIDRVEPLRMFRSVLVPDPVAREVRGHTFQERLAPLRAVLERATPNGVEWRLAERWMRMYSLGPVDALVLAMARCRGIGVVLTDDLDLREAAHHAGVRPVGTVGLLVRAATDGVLSAAEGVAALDALWARSSLFLTRPLVEEAKRALKGRGR